MATFAMLGLTALSTGIAVAGHIKEGEAAQAAAEANARSAEQYAQMTRDQYAKKVDMEKFQNKIALGSIRAAYGASGVTMDGSPQEYMEQSEAVAKTNEMNLQYEGILKARSYMIEAKNYRQGGSYAGQAASLGAWSAGIKGVSTAVEQIYGSGGQRASLYS